LLITLAEVVVLLLFSFMWGWTAYSLPALIVGVRQIRRRKDVNENDRKSVSFPDLPFFSLIVPMKDEEKVAGRILDALMKTNYPSHKYEIVVVDDASVDQTLDICKKFESLYPGRIRYFRRNEAYGKPSALNYALKFAKGEIIGVFDADNLPEPDVLLKTAKYFKNQNLVAVQGLLSSINAEENALTKFIHYEGILHFNALLSGKDKLGLFVPFAGTCLFVRREVLEEVGGWRDDALSEDLELSARLMEKGYHVKFASDVKSWQENPSKFRQLVGQRIRWFRGCLEVAFKYGGLLKHFDRRSLDAEVFFAGPFVMVLVLVTYLLSLVTIFQPFSLGTYANILTQSMSLLTLLTLCALGIGLAYATTPRRVSNVKWVPFIYLYWAIQVFVAFYAFMQIVFRRPRKWTKTSRTGVVTAEQLK
jgi:cellulose synthase/poly-beta-1,6-N-acetylglucosamine synthase-like glycosyltransferase